MRIIENALTITLKENNTVVVGAKLDAEVAARTWIWKGIRLGKYMNLNYFANFKSKPFSVSVLVSLAASS